MHQSPEVQPTLNARIRPESPTEAVSHSSEIRNTPAPTTEDIRRTEQRIIERASKRFHRARKQYFAVLEKYEGIVEEREDHGKLYQRRVRRERREEQLRLREREIRQRRREDERRRRTLQRQGQTHSERVQSVFREYANMELFPIDNHPAVYLPEPSVSEDERPPRRPINTPEEMDNHFNAAVNRFYDMI
uniref:BZIP domain-containing protein n=1 Tax=Caenorhabditis tropicalis TaxID=1561998 RepID=A0A1I7UXA7_9PELO